MTELLLNWLNNEIVLSKSIKDIPMDFRNGYLFAELLYKTKQIPKLSLFKNSNNYKDMIHNFCHLQKSFLDIGVVLNENSRNEIINCSPYASKIYLFKIKQILSKKNIDLTQLKIKESKTLQNLYNKICFKNDNEKYLYNLQLKIGNKGQRDERTLKKNYSAAYLPILGKSFENILDNKYAVNGSLYNEFKKKYGHLNFDENDIKMIMEDMKENENKLIYLKDKVINTENKRKVFFKEKNDEIKKNWENSMINMENFKIKKIKDSWEPTIKYKLLCQNYFRKNANNMAEMSDDFDNNLKFLIDETGNSKNKELRAEIIMLRMRQKLNDRIKNKRDKEKRERKRLREEKEMNYRIFSQKSMNDMVSVMENNLKKEKENNEPIKINDSLLNNIDIKKEEENKINEPKSRNKLKIPNEKTETTDFKIKDQFIQNEENKNIIEENKEKEEKERMGQTATSSYSKLSANDYGLGLINECLSIHNFNLNINDRIQLFKTLILPINKEEIEKNYKKLPKLDINSSSTNQSLIKNYSCSNIYDKSISFNNSDIKKFNKEEYIEEINKINLEDFSKEYKKKLDKFEKNKNLMLPIFNEIFDLAEYVQNYQERKGVYLIDNLKWDKLMIKFKNKEKIDEDEDNKNNTKNENDTKYLFNYGDKLTNEDDKKIFDYINYIDIFNDLIIPNELRGKKYLYPELYKDFYIKQNNGGIDIKEYEPNEEESENLYMPKNSIIKDFKLSDILENLIDTKYNNKNTKEGINTNIYEQRGKYYFIPIKMIICGYPLSGKKTQSLLLSEKYKGIKIYNPEQLLENKMKEYKEYKENKEQPDKHVATAKGKHKKKEDPKKEIEEKMKEFEPVLKIINPYIEYLNKINKVKEKEKTKKEKEEKKDDKKKNKKKKKNIKKNEEEKKKIEEDKTQDNITQEDININTSQESILEKEELLRDIYRKLIIYQIEKDFPEEKNSKTKFVENLREKYIEYTKIKEKIKELKNKIEEEEIKEKEKEKEITDKKSKNKTKKNQVLINLNKELDNTTKTYIELNNSLYIGFIIINYPKNLKEAEKLEKYFTGYESEFEKDPEESEKKLYNYDSIIDINIKNNKKINGQFSFIDLFIELKIDSNEVERRYNGAKYDPLTGTIYHTEDNPLGKEDKKKEKNLVPGVPNFTKEEFYQEKFRFEKDIIILERLYKAMSNGFSKVYKSIDQTDKNYIHNINTLLENTITELMFNNYYNKIDDIINSINNDNIIDIKDKNKEGISTISNQHQSKEEILNSSIDILKTMNNASTNNNLISITEEILTDIDSFYLNYKSNLRNFIHFIYRQKDHIINYLTIIQNDFITYLNRKTEKTEIAQVYIEKYNNLLENHPEIKNNPIVYNELTEDIKDVTKSIWVNIQNKKSNDVKYLQEIKNSGKKEEEINKFIEYIILIFESEIEKYLIICETIIKYYLSKYNLFNTIYETPENNNNSNKFKIDYKKYLFEETDLPNHNNNNNNNTNNINKEDELYSDNRNNNNEKNDIDNTNNLFYLNKNEKKSIEEKIDILFTNCLKIIIRQDEIIRQYIDKIKIRPQHNEKQSVKLLNNTSALSLENNSKKGNSSSVVINTHRSLVPKKKWTKKKLTTDSLSDNIIYEEMKNLIVNEKRKFKYRLIFLKYYTLRYSNIINECFNETYNAMDDLIIMSVRSQNNTLNEFMNYLNKSLNNFYNKISLDNFEFDSYDIYLRYKKDINIIYEKMKYNVIFNTDKILFENNKDNENEHEENKKKNKILINEDEMSYIQLFAYNLNDLMYIYSYIKTYGANTCNFLVKYDIVKEILVRQYFTKKKYGIYDNKKDENNNNYNSNNMLYQFLSEENNGICKKILFSSNINYINFLNRFSLYNNNYININELFNALILLGSQIITSEKFMELIKEYLPENKKELKNILLNKDEFMKIPLWFEKDEYLNVLYDNKEQEYYLDIAKYYYSEENIEENKDGESKPIKINAIKSAIFEINSEDNILDLNKIIVLLNKINNINENTEENKKQKDIQNISDITNINITIEDVNKKSENDTVNAITLNEISNNKTDMNMINISKGKETDSKGTLTLQSDLEIKRKRKNVINKDNINNIFNELFSS